MDGLKIKLANWIAYKMCEIRQKWEVENNYWVNDKLEIWCEYDAMYDDLMTHERSWLLDVFVKCNDESFIDWLVDMYFKGRLATYERN